MDKKLKNHTILVPMRKSVLGWGLTAALGWAMSAGAFASPFFMRNQDNSYSMQYLQHGDVAVAKPTMAKLKNKGKGKLDKKNKT